ncbi:unnamed protein product [Effrenium voratum]|uniref:GST N-terminal domain-containing protein n=1 Tax=Effrenium voratum TaxID=2562239 RepID=A0AA36HS15_9DINO|nr:unnamed protein product [Effrenium voratum]
MKRSVLRAAELKLYQYAICPFCNKTKAALEFLKVPYKPVEVDPLTRSQISFSKDYKKVPIAVFSDGAVVGGSTQIVDKVMESEDAAKQIDASHFLSDEARKWSTWCDEKFAVCVYPNITRNVSECWQALGYLQKCPEFSPARAFATRAVGALGMAAAHGKIKKKYQMDNERDALFTAVDAWTAEVGSKSFRGGEKPDLSDLAVFGCIRGLSDLPLYSEMADHKVLAALVACSWDAWSFVHGPARLPVELVSRRASAAAASGTEKAAAPAAKSSGDQEIDDAVLRMAMAMSEDEDGSSAATATVKKTEEEGFDFNILVTVFWVSLILYSFGSSIIGVTQGRIQDRTGGDFTLYDFFDNIFAFSEWNWEYSLGFDPFKLFDSLKNGGSAPPS